MNTFTNRIGSFISHGNADVERGFSINENIVVLNRSLLSELSINSLCTTYDAVKFAAGESVHKVPIDKELIKAVQHSHSCYKEELMVIAKAAAEQMKKEREERKDADEMNKQMLKQEEDLLVKQKGLQQQQQEANLIIGDASGRLQDALKRKDCVDIDRATILIDGGSSIYKIIGDELFKITEDLINIQKKGCIC